MKIVKPIILLLIVSLLLTFSCRRVKARQDYDNTVSALFVQNIFAKIINPLQDTQKLYGNCIKLLSQDVTAEEAKRNFWATVVKKYRKNSPFSINSAITFLKSANLELVSSGETIKCGDYIISILNSETTVQGELVQSGLRTELDKIFGTARKSEINSHGKIVTHLINDRYNSLASPEFFRRLNHNKI